MIKSIDLVPSSIRSDPQVIAACGAIDIELEEIYKEIPDVAFWADLERVTGKLLDILMWEMHVDISQNLVDGTPFTDAQKKEAINRSIVWHQKKGTKWAVEQVLRTAWPTATVVEWFQYGGRPHFFRVIVDEDIYADLELLNRVVDAIMDTKPVRSWLEPDGFVRPVYSYGGMFAGGLAISRDKIRIPSYGEDRMPRQLVIDRIEPTSAPVSTNIELHVYGRNFSPNSAVGYITTVRPTTYVDSGHLIGRFGTGAQALLRNVFVREENLPDSNIVLLDVFIPLGDYPAPTK